MYLCSITQYLFIFLLILIDFHSKPLIFFTALIQFLFFSFIYVNSFWVNFLILVYKYLGLTYSIIFFIVNYYYEFHVYIVYLYYCIIILTFVVSIPIFLVFYYRFIDIESHIDTLRLIFKISLKIILFFFLLYDNDSFKNILFFVWLLTFLINLHSVPDYETSKTIIKSNRRIKVASITESELEKLHNHIKSTNKSFEQFSFASQTR